MYLIFIFVMRSAFIRTIIVNQSTYLLSIAYDSWLIPEVFCQIAISAFFGGARLRLRELEKAQDHSKAVCSCDPLPVAPVLQSRESCRILADMKLAEPQDLAITLAKYSLQYFCKCNA